MIAACPRCGTRFRIQTRIPANGARLRCTRCEAVFRVRSPRPAGASPAEATAGAPSGGGAGRAAPEAPLVLVAGADPDVCKDTAGALRRLGLPVLVVHDGVEAVLEIQRRRPRAVVLDAALPKMYGFQVCELVKRNESLCGTRVVLVGAVYERRRYRRPPGDLYGADAYLEQSDLREGLPALLAGFGLPLRGAPSAPERSAAAPPDPRVDPAASSEPEAAAGDPLAEGRAEAERLARIIVSDIVLYNEEKFGEAVRAGDVRRMEPELEEGRALFRSRIDARVREERDFLRDELVRVARARGMR